MNKTKVINILEELITKLYSNNEISSEDITEIKQNIVRIDELIKNNKFSREITLMLNTLSLVKNERKENMKIAIISNLEQELRKLKESN